MNNTINDTVTPVSNTLRSLAGRIARVLPYFKSLRSTECRARLLFNPLENSTRFYLSVRDAMERLAKASQPSLLEIEIIDSCGVEPELILAFHDLLSNRPSRVRLRVVTRFNLIDGLILLPILADEVHIGAHCWWECVDPLKIEEEKDCIDGDEWKKPVRRGAGSTDEPAPLADHRTLRALLGQYLPYAEYSGRRVPLAATLRDFGLIPGDQADFLTRCLTMPMPTTPAVSAPCNTLR